MEINELRNESLREKQKDNEHLKEVEKLTKELSERFEGLFDGPVKNEIKFETPSEKIR